MLHLRVWVRQCCRVCDTVVPALYEVPHRHMQHTLYCLCVRQCCASVAVTMLCLWHCSMDMINWIRKIQTQETWSNDPFNGKIYEDHLWFPWKHFRWSLKPIYITMFEQVCVQWLLVQLAVAGKVPQSSSTRVIRFFKSLETIGTRKRCWLLRFIIPIRPLFVVWYHCPMIIFIIIIVTIILDIV